MVTRALLLLGSVLVLGTLLLLLFDKVPGLGRLPGDLVIRRERWTLYVPITSAILISLVLTLLLNLLRRR